MEAPKPEAFNLAAKKMRAQVIKAHLRAIGAPKRPVVCFTCGNTAKALIEAGLDVLTIGPTGPLLPTKWWSQEDIARSFPGHFDGTSGHLPLYLMEDVAMRMADWWGWLAEPGDFEVLAGSGETAVCMALAAGLGGKRIIPVYDNRNPATTYDIGAPLNALVGRLCGPAKMLP